jgi:cation diffusion facilitator family transporter
MVINIVVSLYLSKVGKETDSIALKADALHLRTDVYSSLVILIGLILIKITGISIIDPILALIIAFIITFTSIKLCRQTVKNLLDTALPEEEIEQVQNLLNNHLNKDIVGIKVLRTRKSGAQRLIQITIIVHKNITIKEGHNICDEIEKEILDLFKSKAIISIHLEPCDNNCDSCK